MVGNVFSECAPITLEDSQRISKHDVRRLQNAVFPRLDKDNIEIKPKQNGNLKGLCL